jgi:hypothetical protein
MGESSGESKKVTGPEDAGWADAAAIRPGQLAEDHLRPVLRAKAPTPFFPEPEEEKEELPPAPQVLRVGEVGRGAVRFDESMHEHGVEHVKPAFQPKPEIDPETALPVAANWGKEGARSYGWMLWAVGGTVLAVIVGLAVQPLLHERRGARQASGFERFQVAEEEPKDETPTSYFEENADVVARELHELLVKYAKARTVEEVLPLVRDGERVKAGLEKHWQSWGAPATWSGPPSPVIGYGVTGDRPYAFMNGTRPDFSPFQMFFVRENDRLWIDWEATEGVGSCSFEELSEPSVKEAELRAIVSPGRYYSPAFPESAYRAFQLVAQDKVSYVWGYAPLGSPVETGLSELFARGVILKERVRSEPVRLKLVRGPEGAQGNQWLITDMLHKGWVAP